MPYRHSASPNSLAVIRGGGNGKDVKGIGRDGKEEGWSGRWRDDRERGGGLDLDICPWAPEFL